MQGNMKVGQLFIGDHNTLTYNASPQLYIEKGDVEVNLENHFHGTINNLTING